MADKHTQLDSRPQGTKSLPPVPFNRKRKTPPEYLHRLRVRGYWRAQNFFDGASYADANGNDIPDGPWRFNRSTALTEAQFAPKGTFVDAGCGCSADANIAAERLGYRKCYKIDLFSITSGNPYFDRGMKKSDKKNKITFIQGDICERQAIPDNSVDLIVCSAVIDLVPEKDRVLFYKEAYRMLKPGGQLSISITHLKNGYGTEIFIERDRCTQSGWGVGFVLERNYPTGFIMEKPGEAIT